MQKNIRAILKAAESDEWISSNKHKKKYSSNSGVVKYNEVPSTHLQRTVSIQDIILQSGERSSLISIGQTSAGI